MSDSALKKEAESWRACVRMCVCVCQTAALNTVLKNVQSAVSSVTSARLIKKNTECNKVINENITNKIS